MYVGDTITWTITRCNTSTDDVDLNICVNDPVAGINNDCMVLGPGQCDDIIADANTTECGPITNTATGTATLVRPDLGNTYPLEAEATCEVLCFEICRTPGFWTTHACAELCPEDALDPNLYNANCEHPRSQNITQTLSMNVVESWKSVAAILQIQLLWQKNIRVT
jgi:hypothetical protein